MDWETFKAHKKYAGEKNPSMLRRRVGHDYSSRCIYLITMTTEGRKPLLGSLKGNADAPEGTADAPHIELSELGKSVKACWKAIETYHPEVRIFSIMIMPDHIHGILFVETNMESHLGEIIKGFKTGCNKEYRRLEEKEMKTRLQQCCSKENNQANTDKEQKEDKKGLLWSRNYNDRILEGPNELDQWFKYLAENPRRLAIKRAHPDYFRVRFNIRIAGQNYAAIGNRFLLNHPMKEAVQCSRTISEADMEHYKEKMMSKARKGAVLISPAISKGEQIVMRAALDAHLLLIFLSPWGFNSFSKPGHQYYEACSEGRFLILAPWEHQNQRIPLTREMCLELNRLTKDICEWEGC